MASPCNKHSNIRIVVLKEVPRKYHFTQFHDINEDHLLKLSNEKLTKQQFISKTSIPYLSSALQDQNILSENSNTIAAHTSPNRYDNFDTNYNTQRDSTHKIQTFKHNYRKKGDRYLSCLLMNDHKTGSYRIKTESINKLITQSKCTPIDRLKQGKKNIKFSLKNKLDLIQDFSCFVRQKTVTQQVDSNSLEQKTVVFKRRRQDNKLSYLKKNLNRRQVRAHTQKNTTVFQHKSEFSSSSKQVIGDAKGFAAAFKQLKNDFPIIKDFGWSKLNDGRYKLTSN